jgi:Domain of unknown function (DUF4252)
MYTRTLVAGAAGLMLPLLACSQGPELRLPSFPDFKQPATETVNITLGASPLHFAASLMDDHDSDTAGVKKALEGVKSVQIRSYRFASDYACSQADLGPLRSQLSQPGWTRLVETHKRDKENVEVYVALDDTRVKGVAIIACQPREFTIVNVVGTIDLDQVARLRHTFAPGTTGTM